MFEHHERDQIAVRVQVPLGVDLLGQRRLVLARAVIEWLGQIAARDDQIAAMLLFTVFPRDVPPAPAIRKRRRVVNGDAAGR